MSKKHRQPQIGLPEGSTTKSGTFPQSGVAVVAGGAALRWLSRAVFVVFGAAILCLAAVLLVNMDRAWPVAFQRFGDFSVTAFVPMATMAVFSIVAADCMKASAFNIVFALLAGCLYLSTPTAPLGNLDGVVRQAPTLAINVPEILQNLLAHVLYPFMDLGRLPPVAGAVTAWTFQTACDQAFRRSSRPPGDAKRIGSLMYLATVMNILFFRGFSDSTTAPSVPFQMLLVFFAVRYLRRSEARFDPNCLWAALAMLTACMFHASNLFLTPVLAVMVGMRRLPARQFRLGAMELAAVLLAPALLCGGTVWALQSAGFVLYPGSVLGGADLHRFVPLGKIPSPFCHFTMFSLDHAIQTANIAALAAPVAALAVLVAGRSILRGDGPKDKAVFVFLGTLAMSYLCFIALWGFDLGFPADIYLMLGTSLPTQLFVTVMLLRMSRTWAYLLAAMSLGYAWMNLFILLR